MQVGQHHPADYRRYSGITEVEVSEAAVEVWASALPTHAIMMIHFPTFGTNCQQHHE
jgi:hypothetical protein